MTKLAQKLGDNGIYNPFDLQNINNQQIYNYDDEIQYQPIQYLSDFLNYGKVEEVIAFMNGDDVWFIVKGYVTRTTTDAYGNPYSYKKEGWIYVKPSEVKDYAYVNNLINTNSVRWVNKTGKSNFTSTTTTQPINTTPNSLYNFGKITRIWKMKDNAGNVYYSVVGTDKNGNYFSLSVYPTDESAYTSVLQLIAMYEKGMVSIDYVDKTYDNLPTLPDNKIIDIYPEGKEKTTYNDQYQDTQKETSSEHTNSIETIPKSDVLPNQYQNANFLTIETELRKKQSVNFWVVGGFVFLFIVIAFLIWFYVFRKDKGEKNPFKWLSNQFKRLFKGRKQE